MFLGRKKPFIVDGMSMQKMSDEIAHADRVNAHRRRAEFELAGCAIAAACVVMTLLWLID